MQYPFEIVTKEILSKRIRAQPQKFRNTSSEILSYVIVKCPISFVMTWLNTFGKDAAVISEGLIYQL